MSVIEEGRSPGSMVPSEFLDPLTVSNEEVGGVDFSSAATEPEFHCSKRREGPVGEEIEEEGRAISFLTEERHPVAADELDDEGVEVGERRSLDGLDREGRRSGEVSDGESNGLEGGGESRHGLREEEVVVFRDLDVVKSEEVGSRLKDVESCEELGGLEVCSVDGTSADGSEVGEEFEEGSEGEVGRIGGRFPKSSFDLFGDVQFEFVDVMTERRVGLEGFDKGDGLFEASEGDESIEDGSSVRL